MQCEREGGFVMWGGSTPKVETKPEPPKRSPEEQSEWDAYTASLRAYHARTNVLQAELEALQPPADLYRVSKDHTNGTYSVLGWAKEISEGFRTAGWTTPRGVPTPMRDDRRVLAYHHTLITGLPTHKAAEAWLRAYIDPTTNQTHYDAEGKRITETAQ